jgi:hypothetical protein
MKMGIWRSDIGLWVAYYITTRNNIQWTDLENIVMQHTISYTDLETVATQQAINDQL